MKKLGVFAYFIIISIMLISNISGYDFDENIDESYNFPEPQSPIIVVNGTTNNSINAEVWQTNLGGLDNVDPTTFQSNGGTLELIFDYIRNLVSGDSFIVLNDSSGDIQITLDESQLDGILNSTSWNRSGTSVFLANNGDDVGIGTTTPKNKLNVIGDINVTDEVNDISMYFENGYLVVEG